MQLQFLKGQQVLVVGLGESGLAMALFCSQAGASVTICDTRQNPPRLEELRLKLPNAVFVASLELSLLETSPRILWSPGLSLTAPEVLAFSQEIKTRQLPIFGELDLFALALEALRVSVGYSPKVLGITGTNGKTTTTALTAHLCRSAGRHAIAAGNISPAMLAALSSALEFELLPDVWVLELSSFQLATAQISNTQSSRSLFSASCILNLSQDHLDWHGSFESYSAAKQKIYQSTEVVVWNRDDSATRWVPLPISEKSSVGKGAASKSLNPKVSAPRALSFGLAEPAELGDLGLQLVNGLPWLVEAVATQDEAPTRKKSSLTPAWRVNKLMPTEVLPMIGLHNAANALAALALCEAIDLPLAKLLRGLKDFKSEPHRCEVVRLLNGVTYVDDSKGTNVGATVAALNGLGPQGPVVLIAGGDGKGQDFQPLVPALLSHAKAIVLIGRDAGLIEQSIQHVAANHDSMVISRSQSLEAAVQAAAQLAQPGDFVLLSPACASFDMFKGYIHRAEVFKAAVQALPQVRTAEPDQHSEEVPQL